MLASLCCLTECSSLLSSYIRWVICLIFVTMLELQTTGDGKKLFLEVFLGVKVWLETSKTGFNETTNTCVNNVVAHPVVLQWNKMYLMLPPKALVLSSAPSLPPGTLDLRLSPGHCLKEEQSSGGAWGSTDYTKPEMLLWSKKCVNMPSYPHHL